LASAHMWQGLAQLFLRPHRVYDREMFHYFFGLSSYMKKK
jgi:hypothetical protein